MLEADIPSSEGSIIDISSDALGSTMDLVPRSDDGSQRQEQDHHATGQVAMPKPSQRRKKTLVKEKSTQTTGLVTTTEASTQAGLSRATPKAHGRARGFQGSTVAMHTSVAGFGSRRRRSSTLTTSTQPPWDGGPPEARDIANNSTLLSLVDSPRPARVAVEASRAMVLYDRRVGNECVCFSILVLLLLQIAHILLCHDGWVCTEVPLDVAGTAKGTPVAAAKFSKIGSLKNVPDKLLMRKGITVDSGAHSNVMPKRMINESRMRPSPGSIKGTCFVAADNGRIPNEGEIDLEFDTLEGSQEAWVFQIANTNKPLASVADRVDHRCRVVFDKDDDTGQDISYIYDKGSKRVSKMRREGNVWKMDAIVTPNMIMSSQEMDFSRQG